MANLAQIQKYLLKHKLSYKLVDLGEDLPAGRQGVYTVEGVKKAGINEAEIVKTLIVRASSQFIALALRGNDRVDFNKIRSHFGSKSELAKPEEVLKITGVPVGAVCPILLTMPVYIDRQVLNLKNVHMGSGDLTKGLEMRINHFLEAIDSYEVEEFAIA